jgi:hypothetical protein
LFEPFSGNNNFTVDRIERSSNSDQKDFLSLRVINKKKTEQLILQALNEDALHKQSDWQFQGSFGIVNIENNHPTYLYLGHGKLLAYRQYMVESTNLNGSINLEIDQNKLSVSCNQESRITIKGSRAKTVTITTNGKTTELPIKISGMEISFLVPAGLKAAEIRVR